MPSFASGLSLSITPTLFEMSVQPQQSWNSSVKVINNNRTPLTVYADVVNFEPQGEFGRGKFSPVFEDFTEGKTLAEWMTVPDEPIVIPPEGSVQVPVAVQVPEDAAPGGHFAAILIGTVPPEDDKPLQIATSQIVTSLFFVRIAGDVVENGTVRTFVAKDSFLSSPEATFEVRFENKGNVHLQPRGEIVITNMWGKERGIVPINHETHFGNVLPESIRKFEFTWKGEQSFTDIGRYKAALTLAYGRDEQKFTTQSTYFWVVPIKQVLTVLGSLFAILWFVSWVIRAYVRRMLDMAGVEAYVPPSQRKGRVVKKGDVLISEKVSVQAPLKAGVHDFKSKIERTKAFKDTLEVLFNFVLQYKKFFISIIALIVLSVVVWNFFGQVMQSQRDYEVTIENPDTDITISSEEILYERNQHNLAKTTKQATSTQQTFLLTITNSSDTPGAAAALQSRLENDGYVVTSLQSDFGAVKPRTVIVYDVRLQEEALALSKILDNALLSAQPTEDENTKLSITIFVGDDLAASE